MDSNGNTTETMVGVFYRIKCQVPVVVIFPCHGLSQLFIINILLAAGPQGRHWTGDDRKTLRESFSGQSWASVACEDRRGLGY